MPRLIRSHALKPLEDVGRNPVNSAEVSKGWLSVLLTRQTDLDFLPPFVSLISHVLYYMQNSMLWLHTKDMCAHLWDHISQGTYAVNQSSFWILGADVLYMLRGAALSMQHRTVDP